MIHIVMIEFNKSFNPNHKYILCHKEDLSLSQVGPIERYPTKPEFEIITGGLLARSLKTDVFE